MNLLLKANFSRLWKDGAFWASLAVMAGVGLFEVAVGVSARRQGISVPLENRYFVLALMPGIVLSAFCSLFVGGEYSGGTIRNKITVGHTRDAVYLASLCTCIAAGGLACLAYIVPMVVLGIPLLGIFQMELGAVVWFTLCVFVMTGSLCAVFTLIAILNQNRAVTAIICITLAYFLLFLGIYLNSRLTELEIIPGSTSKTGRSSCGRPKKIRPMSAASNGRCTRPSTASPAVRPCSWWPRRRTAPGPSRSSVRCALSAAPPQAWRCSGGRT